MDSNTDDRDPEVPPEVPPDELQEALQWLAELTGPTSVSPTADETVDSPFHGLVDDGAGDLPDWLREAPKEPVEPRLTDEGEFESRLDWLAKMAERESIEELPTLEWRNLSGTPQSPTADDTLPPAFPAELLPVEATPLEPLTAEAVLLVPDEVSPPAAGPDAEALAAPLPDAPESLIVEAVLLVPDETSSPAAAPEAEALPPLPDDAPTTTDPATPITPEALLDTLPPDEELPPIDDLDAAMAWIEELAASQDAPIEDVPSVADRALASKLLMEAGLSPDGLDRRLPDELSLGDLSLLEGNTPVNAFVAAEDFADTIVLVETMAAEQGRPLPAEYPAREAPNAAEASFEEAMAFLDELAIDREPLGAQTQPLEALDAPAVGTVRFVTDELQPIEEPPPISLAEQPSWPPFDEEPAETWLTEPEATAEPETAGVVEVPADVTDLDEVEQEVALTAETTDTAEPDGAEPELAWTAETTDMLDSDEALSPDEAPWREPITDEMAMEWSERETDGAAAVEAVVPVTAMVPELAAEVATANGGVSATLEELLRDLDALALPPGRSLVEFDASMQQSGVLPVRRDLPAAVEWLELALGISVPTTRPTPQWSDDELITQMPDDPDAVLAWLEQLAEEDTVDSSPQLSPADDAQLERAAEAVEPLIDELSAADLQNMPEDPDAVMAWLEGLAGSRSEATSVPPPTAPAGLEAPLPPTPPAAEQSPPVTSSRSRRRRGRKTQPLVAPVTAAEADAVAIEPPMTADAPAWEAIASEITPDVTPATLTLDAPLEVVDAPVWEETADVTAPDASLESVGDAGAALFEEADAAPTTEVEVDVPAITPVEEAMAAPSEAAGELPTELATLPLAARPRRRGRKPKTAPETAGAAEEATGAKKQAGDAVEAQAQPSPENEESPPPAKPTSWVDLLKPLK